MNRQGCEDTAQKKQERTVVTSNHKAAVTAVTHTVTSPSSPQVPISQFHLLHPVLHIPGYPHWVYPEGCDIIKGLGNCPGELARDKLRITVSAYT